MKINWPAPSSPWGGFCLALLWPSPIVQAPSHTHHRCRVCSHCRSTGMEKVPGVWEPASRPRFHSLSAKHKPCIKNSTMKSGTCSSAEHYLEKDWKVSLEHLACVSQGTQNTENLRANLAPAALHFRSSARCLCLVRCRSTRHSNHRPRAAQQTPAQPQALLPSQSYLQQQQEYTYSCLFWDGDFQQKSTLLTWSRNILKICSLVHENR